MLIQDTILNSDDRKFLLDLVLGSINRICVSDNPKEMLVHIASINVRLSRIAQSRILELSQNDDGTS